MPPKTDAGKKALHERGTRDLVQLRDKLNIGPGERLPQTGIDFGEGQAYLANHSSSRHSRTDRGFCVQAEGCPRTLSLLKEGGVTSGNCNSVLTHPPAPSPHQSRRRLTRSTHPARGGVPCCARSGFETLQGNLSKGHQQGTWRTSVRLGVLVILGSIAVFCGSLKADPKPKSWTWKGGAYTPCEGIGANGVYSVLVEATVETAGAGVTTIKTLGAYASSGAFLQGKGSLGMTVRVVDASGKTLSSRRLASPVPGEPSMTTKPSATDTASVFLRVGETLSVPKGGRLTFQAAVAVDLLPTGHCGLNPSSLETPPF